jgi:Zn-dependent protease with chaperone function
MTLGLVILCLAAAALVAYATSGIVALGLVLGRSWLPRLASGARARLLLVLSVLPAVATAIVMLAALSPSFGWVADHCGVVESAHEHPHICGHPVTSLPALSIIALALYFAARVAWPFGRALASVVSSARTMRALARTAGTARFGDAYVLPLDAPHAFVVGALFPRVFVSRGLLAVGEAHVATVLAHENAHVSRADGLRRLVARAVAGFHLPGVALRIGEALGRAQEMAADESAAQTLGSRTRVADALVRLARTRSHAPCEAHAFHASDLELRVRSLLDDCPRIDAPRPLVLLLALVALVVAVGLGAEGIHHGLEHALGLLS